MTDENGVWQKDRGGKFNNFLIIDLEVQDLLGNPIALDYFLDLECELRIVLENGDFGGVLDSVNRNSRKLMNKHLEGQNGKLIIIDADPLTGCGIRIGGHSRTSVKIRINELSKKGSKNSRFAVCFRPIGELAHLFLVGNPKLSASQPLTIYSKVVKSATAIAAAGNGSESPPMNSPPSSSTAVSTQQHQQQLQHQQQEGELYSAKKLLETVFSKIVNLRETSSHDLKTLMEIYDICSAIRLRIDVRIKPTTSSLPTFSSSSPVSVLERDLMLKIPLASSSSPSSHQHHHHATVSSSSFSSTDSILVRDQQAASSVEQTSPHHQPIVYSSSNSHAISSSERDGSLLLAPPLLQQQPFLSSSSSSSTTLQHINNNNTNHPPSSVTDPHEMKRLRFFSDSFSFRPNSSFDFAFQSSSHQPPHHQSPPPPPPPPQMRSVLADLDEWKNISMDDEALGVSLQRHEFSQLVHSLKLPISPDMQEWIFHHLTTSNTLTVRDVQLGIVSWEEKYICVFDSCVPSSSNAGEPMVSWEALRHALSEHQQLLPDQEGLVSLKGFLESMFNTPPWSAVQVLMGFLVQKKF